MKWLRRLFGKRQQYKAGSLYKFYSQLNWNLVAGQLAYQF